MKDLRREVGAETSGFRNNRKGPGCQIELRQDRQNVIAPGNRGCRKRGKREKEQKQIGGKWPATENDDIEL